jgi:SOS-response transcriptional repressor LexA
VATRKKRTHVRYRNDPLLKVLGQHCARFRKRNGYSMDRMAKESEMSASVIFRLEKGEGAITVASLFRYAQTLGMHPKELFDFPMDELMAGEIPTHTAAELEPAFRAARSTKILDSDDVAARNLAFKTHLPVFSLKAAAGYFGAGEAVEPEGWMAVDGLKAGASSNRHLFIAKAVGRSMEPKIHSGDMLLFRSHPTGTRQGKIVLAQYRGAADPETGGAYTVKRYSSAKTVARDGGWAHTQVVLSPLNPDYEPIAITAADAEHIKIVAELLRVL